MESLNSKLSTSNIQINREKNYFLLKQYNINLTTFILKKRAVYKRATNKRKKLGSWETVEGN